MTIQIGPERLAAFESITLDFGPHPTFTSGHCAMEVVAWLAGEGHTDAPSCASRVLRSYTVTLNDLWNDEQRQRLKPFLPRMIGTGDDGKDAARGRIALDHLAQMTVPWLELAGIDTTAITSATTVQETQEALRVARAAAWQKKAERRSVLWGKARDVVAARGKPATVAGAVADAVTDAVLDAADALDTTLAPATGTAAAAADAAAAAAAHVIGVADSSLAAATVAAAAAAAVADAAVVVADAVDAAVNANGSRWYAAYEAVRDYYRENPTPAIQAITELARKQDDAALNLLDRLITAEGE